MSKRKRRVFRREFKLSAVQRMIAGERRADLSRELGVPVSHLWQWWAHFRRGGVEALRFQAKRTTADAPPTTLPARKGTFRHIYGVFTRVFVAPWAFECARSAVL